MNSIKKTRSILLGIYIINFLILLIIYIKNIMAKELGVENYIAVYFWIINLIEIIIFVANLKKINKKSSLIAITVVFLIQTIILFCLPAYSQYKTRFTKDKDGFPMTIATVMPKEYNANGINIKY